MPCRTVYWAGALFNHKELIGNALLAQAFNRQAEGKWKAVLPQDSEGRNGTRSVRDCDFTLLFQADAIIANFDGTELDSGTVVEFCFAKLLDLPAVLLRTDFRDGNNRGTCPDPWNLMCSGYPRTRPLLMPAFPGFQKSIGNGPGLNQAIEQYCDSVAEAVLKALRQETERPSRTSNPQELASIYRLATQTAGGDLADHFTDQSIGKLVQAKLSRRIYHD